MGIEKKEKRNIIIIIVATVLLLAAMIGGWYFAMVKPVEAQRLVALKNYTDRKAVADRLETAQIDQRKAEARLVEVTGQLQFFRRLYRSLEFGAMGPDPASENAVQKAERERTWRGWLREYFTDYADAFTSTLDAKAAQSGVQIERSIKVAAPPQTPEDVVAPANGFLKPASAGGSTSGAPGGGAPTAAPGGAMPGAAAGGAAAPGGIAIRATGTLPQLIDFFQRLNNSPILMVVQNIKLDSSGGGTGTQTGLNAGAPGATPAGLPGGATAPAQNQSEGGIPKVTATFNVVPYLLARGAGATITSGAGAAPASTPGAGPGVAMAPGAPPGVGAPPGIAGAPAGSPPTP